MKIAVDARIVYTTTGRYVERLLAYLQQTDHDNEYVVLLLKKDFDRWQPTAANFTKLVADYPPYTIREQVQFALQLRRLKVDLVHFTMPQQPLWYSGRRVTTVHDLTLVDFVNKRKQGLLKDLYKNYVKPPIFRFLIWYIIRTSVYLITPTQFVKQQLIDRFGAPEARVSVTYEAGELTSTSSSPYAAAKGKRYLLYVGNAYPYKNLRALVDAFALLTQTDYELILVGKRDFFYEELENYVGQQGIKGVTFTGYVPDEELAWLYQHATLYIFPSLSEGFGLPGLEAMAYGLAVLASNATTLPEVYGPGAEYFDPRDSRDIAHKIDELLGDPKRREQLRRAGEERLKQFSWEKMARETLEVYRAAAQR